MSGERHVFTIPAGAPFLATLVDALHDGRLIRGFAPSGNPFAMADVTLYLPTRRAARAIREPLMRRGGGAALLPRILTLGDIDEDDLADSPLDDTAEDDALAPAIGETERQLALTKLVLSGRISDRATRVVS